MHALQERILLEGKNLGRGILNVDGFINHQIDPALMFDCGKDLAELFRDVGTTKVLTAETSGIVPALMAGYHLGVPVVFARKRRTVTMPDQVFLTISPSHTQGVAVELIVSPEHLSQKDRVLIIDDFLATGATILGLAHLATAAGATVVGIGALIEKGFEGGRDRVRHLGKPIHALVTVTSMDDGKIAFADPLGPSLPGE